MLRLTPTTIHFMHNFPTSFSKDFPCFLKMNLQCLHSLTFSMGQPLMCHHHGRHALGYSAGPNATQLKYDGRLLDNMWKTRSDGVLLVKLLSATADVDMLIVTPRWRKNHKGNCIRAKYPTDRVLHQGSVGFSSVWNPCTYVISICQPQMR